MNDLSSRHPGIPREYGPYSHALEAGDFVFVAGQIARSAETGKLIEGDVTAQTRRVIEIVAQILDACGLTLDNVVRSAVYLASISHFGAMNAVYEKMFKPPFPARSTPQAQLPFGALVGVEVTAYRGVRQFHPTSTRSSAHE